MAREGALALNSFATTTSTGSTISRFSALALSMMSRAVCTRSCSTSDLPTGLPNASKNVLAMAPPMIRASTFCNRFDNRSSLVEILAPPTIAATGRSGFSSAFSSATSSSSMVAPA